MRLCVHCVLRETNKTDIMAKDTYFPKLQDIANAKITLADIISPTPLMENMHLSGKYEANVFLKREDLSVKKKSDSKAADVYLLCRVNIR